MAQKSFAKHSEYRTYSTSGNYGGDGDFDSMKTELLPSKYGSLIQPGNGVPPGNKEYYYEYKEEKNPSGTYDRKDLRTVEQYDFSHSPSNRGTGVAPLALTSSTPRKGDLTHNIEELDSLLDDLQKDQERKPYKSGYSSDTMESSSFDYRSASTPVKSAYSSMSRVEKDVGWSPPPASISREVNREVIRNLVTESHIVPAVPQAVPAIVCDKCHPPAQVSGVPMNKVTTTVKTYTYEVPAGQDPTLVPLPGTEARNTSSTTRQEKFLTTDRSVHQENQEHRTYVNTQFNTSPAVSPRQPSPLVCTHCQQPTTTVIQPVTHVCPHGHTSTLSQTHVHAQNTSTTIPPSSAPGPHVCPNCSQRITTTTVHTYPDGPTPIYPGHDTTKLTSRTTHYTTNTVDNRSPYPASSSPPYSVPADNVPKQPNQGPPGTAVYKYTTTNYTYNSNNKDGPHGPAGGAGPFPVDHLSPGPRASPFPRTESPAPRTQEPPKRLDDLLADFPGHENYPLDHDELRKRPNPARGPGGAVNGQVSMQEKATMQNQASKAQEQKVSLTPSRNIAGPAVYYPPGHEMFVRKDQSAAYQQAGGGYMKSKGNYKYEAESSSKSKSSSGAAVVPVCLPLCCAMPCVIL